MMRISIIFLAVITQSVEITEYDLVGKNYDQSVASCQAAGQSLASRPELLQYLLDNHGGKLGGDIWSPVFVSDDSDNDWMQIGGTGRWPYGFLHNSAIGGTKPAWGTKAGYVRSYKKKFYCVGEPAACQLDMCETLSVRISKLRNELQGATAAHAFGVNVIDNNKNAFRDSFVFSKIELLLLSMNILITVIGLLICWRGGLFSKNNGQQFTKVILSNEAEDVEKTPINAISGYN